MSLQVALKSLSKGDKEALMYSLESGQTHIVYLSNLRFIAVNLDIIPKHFIVTENKGLWSYGTVAGVS